MMDDEATLTKVLQTCRCIAVVGLSAQPHRASFYVSHYMQSRGYRIVPVNPKYTEILGEKCYASLLDIPFAVDMVNVFRRTDDVLEFAQDAVKIGAKCLWQQLGIVNLQANDLALEAGLDSVMDRCLKIEHLRLIEP